MTEEAQENYQKLVTQVKEIYGDHSHIREQDAGLYFIANSRYGFQTYITLTEGQVAELARGAKNSLDQASRKIDPYLEDYDYFAKKEAESKEIPEDT